MNNLATKRLKNGLVTGFALLFAGAAIVAPGQDDFVQKASPMLAPRAFHGSAVLGDYIYVIGGSIVGTVNGKKGEIATKDVEYAHINSDGTLGAFQNTTPLGQPRHYINNSTLVLNDTVYVIGGSSAILNGKRTNTVAWTRPKSDGSLEPWRESQPFAEAGASSGLALATPGYLHMIGGITNSTVIASVSSIKVSPDGSLSETWEKGPSLPKPRWFHGGAVAGGRVYVWGGLESASQKNIDPSNLIFSAPVLVSGQLGEWRQESVTLTQPFYASSIAVAGPYLFSIAPRYKGRVEGDDIWWSIAGPEGIGQWTKREATLPAKAYHSSATDYRRGVIYFQGGRPGANVMSPATSMIRLSGKAREQAESQWVANEKAHADSVSTRDLAATTPSAPGTAGAGAASIGNPGSFMSFEQGKAQSKSRNQPLLIYFRSANAKPCHDQDEKLKGDALAGVLGSNVLAQVDVQASPQVAQQYAIYRVPTWVAYDANGTELKRATGVLEPADLLTLTKK